MWNILLFYNFYNLVSSFIYFNNNFILLLTCLWCDEMNSPSFVFKLQIKVYKSHSRRRMVKLALSIKINFFYFENRLIKVVFSRWKLPRVTPLVYHKTTPLFYRFELYRPCWLYPKLPVLPSASFFEAFWTFWTLFTAVFGSPFRIRSGKGMVGVAPLAGLTGICRLLGRILGWGTVGGLGAIFTGSCSSLSLLSTRWGAGVSEGMRWASSSNSVSELVGWKTV